MASPSKLSGRHLDIAAPLSSSQQLGVERNTPRTLPLHRPVVPKVWFGMIGPEPLTVRRFGLCAPTSELCEGEPWKSGEV